MTNEKGQAHPKAVLVHRYRQACSGGREHAQARGLGVLEVLGTVHFVKVAGFPSSHQQAPEHQSCNTIV